MIAAIRRAICRALHGGFHYSQSTGECGWVWVSKYLILTCGTRFKDAEESGLLKEFQGRVKLDEHRMLDLDMERVKTYWMDGYRVTQGGREIKVWGSPPEKKVLRPIPVRSFPVQAKR